MANEETIIQLKGMGKEFKTANGPVVALNDINLDIYRGEIFGIIGLSGAGKSTLVRCINMLEVPTSGQVLFEGENLAAMSEAERRMARQSMGMIFQQFNLLSQRTVLKNICFPMEIAKNHSYTKAEAKNRAMELLKLVGLEERAGAYPAQLSGGQKQRVAIARAIATNPKVLLCDEATSALDVSVQAQIIRLLKKLADGMKMSYLFISHDLALVSSLCDKIAVMYHGEIVESGATREVMEHPKEEYTRLLLDSVLSVPYGNQTIS